MPVDVVSEIVIARPRAEVAAYAADPDHCREWYEAIREIRWLTERPVRVGTRCVFVARFLGKRLEYTYEITAWEPGERMAMATAEGPFPMETIYTWADAPGGGTRMALRNRGEPRGFGAVLAPMVAGAMKRNNEKDLARLKARLER